jgi:Transglutaminase-like superfamily
MRLLPHAGSKTFVMQHHLSTQPQETSNACPEGGCREAYFLLDHVYGCEVGASAVILDLHAGGYMGVDGQGLQILRRSVANWPARNTASGTSPCAPCASSAESESLIAGLLARGMLTTSPVPKRLPPPAIAKALTLDVDASLSACVRQAPSFVASLLYASLRHRDQDLALFLAWLTRRQRLIHRVGRPPSSENIKRLLASFFSLRVWFYTADQHCLLDSLVLAVFLTTRRVPCTLMIGVSSKPFLAHAWVQSGRHVLNDTAEHAQMFTPILAAGECQVASCFDTSS